MDPKIVVGLYNNILIAKIIKQDGAEADDFISLIRKINGTPENDTDPNISFFTVESESEIEITFSGDNLKTVEEGDE